MTTKRIKGSSHGQNGVKKIFFSHFKIIFKFEDIRQAREHVRTSASEAQRRTKSVPRRVERDAFEGLDGGLYTKGEVARNKVRFLFIKLKIFLFKERREMAMKGIPIQGGDWKSTNRSRTLDGVGGGVGGRDVGERAPRRMARDVADLARDDRDRGRMGSMGGGPGGGGGLGPDGGADGLDGSLGGSFRNRVRFLNFSFH